MSMSGFELKLWHIITLMFPFLIGLFKQDISNIIFAYTIIRSHKYEKDQKIQIMSNSGVWENCTIIEYDYNIPFRKKRGGILVKGIDSAGCEYLEKVSFNNWKQMRTRAKIVRV